MGYGVRMPSAFDPSALEDLLIALAGAAGEAALPLFRGDHALEDKNKGGRFDPVTEADKGAEAAIRAPDRDAPRTA